MMPTPKPRPYAKPVPVQQSQPDPKKEPVKNPRPFVRRDMAPLKGHEGLTKMLNDLGGLPPKKSPVRSKRKK